MATDINTYLDNGDLLLEEYVTWVNSLNAIERYENESLMGEFKIFNVYDVSNNYFITLKQPYFPNTFPKRVNLRILRNECVNILSNDYLTTKDIKYVKIRGGFFRYYLSTYDNVLPAHRLRWDLNKRNKTVSNLDNKEGFKVFQNINVRELTTELLKIVDYNKVNLKKDPQIIFNDFEFYIPKNQKSTGFLKQYLDNERLYDENTEFLNFNDTDYYERTPQSRIWYDKIRKINKKKCLICGSKDNLEAHHIFG